MSEGLPILRRADSVSFHSMRSWVLVLLLALLPLQSTLATVFVYCKHEAKAEAGHMGHHEHQHQGAVADKATGGPDQQSSGAQQLDDNDCGFCHLSSAQPLGVSVELPLIYEWAESRAERNESRRVEGDRAFAPKHGSHETR